MRFVLEPWVFEQKACKIVDLRDTILDIALDYLALSETKIDQSFLNVQFNIKGYKIRAGRERINMGAG